MMLSGVNHRAGTVSVMSLALKFGKTVSFRAFGPRKIIADFYIADRLLSAYTLEADGPGKMSYTQ